MVVRKAIQSWLIFALAVNCLTRQSASSPTAQIGQPNSIPQSAGMENPWDVRIILANLNTDTEQLRPLVAGLKPQEWFDAKGAPSTYILQWQAAQQQIRDVEQETKLLSQKTGSLPLCLDEYFRMEALDVTLRSLQDGVRKYGDRSTADKMGEVIAHAFNNRERFRGYIRDLATDTEQNFKIADEEAQRCRGMISKEPDSNSKKVRR